MSGDTEHLAALQALLVGTFEAYVLLVEAEWPSGLRADSANWLNQAADDLGHALDALGDEYNALTGIDVDEPWVDLACQALQRATDMA